MSHIAEGTLVYRDLDALRAAVGRLGGEFLTDQHTHAWWGRFVGDSPGLVGRDVSTYGQCLHAIKIQGTSPQNGSSGPWEIGIVQALNGDGYKLVYDAFGSAGRQLETTFGSKLATLAEEYGAEVAIRQLARAGYRTHRIDAPHVHAGR